MPRPNRHARDNYLDKSGKRVSLGCRADGRNLKSAPDFFRAAAWTLRHCEGEMEVLATHLPWPLHSSGAHLAG